MGRKKRKLFMLIPQGVVKHLNVTTDGKAFEYKQAHLLSVLLLHTGSYPSARAFTIKTHHLQPQTPLHNELLKSVSTYLDSKLIEVDRSYSAELRTLNHIN